MWLGNDGAAIKMGKSVVSLSRLLRKSTSGSWRTTNQRSGPWSAAEESRIQRQNSSRFMGAVQARCRYATLLWIASLDNLYWQGKSYLLIYTYTYNHCAYFIHERHNTATTTTTTTTTNNNNSSSSSNCSKGTLAQRLPYGGRRAQRTSRNPRKKDKLVWDRISTVEVR